MADCLHLHYSAYPNTTGVFIIIIDYIYISALNKVTMSIYVSIYIFI